MTRLAIEDAEHQSPNADSSPKSTGIFEIDESGRIPSGGPKQLEPCAIGKPITFASEDSPVRVERSPVAGAPQQHSWSEATEYPRFNLRESRLDLQQATLLQHFVEKISPFVR